MSKNESNTNMTKEQERSELHCAIWQIATDLRPVGRILTQTRSTGKLAI